MATLVLGAIGTLVGGPVGGALGTMLGRGLDSMIIGSPRREGPRLKELAVSTSSYGQPIPALYGAVRVPGTVIWATDLVERRETSGGGKGKPKTTTYSYSVSLAVALSSRPIDAVARIWADGNLLRGRAGDLKTAGTLRVHTGHADQQPDPLMAAAIGAQCPAHRGCAYAVFEDLALEDFGNRIPALSFEVFAGSAAQMVDEMARERRATSQDCEFAGLDGFVHESGSTADILALVDRLKPLSAVARGDGVSIEGLAGPAGAIPLLPAAAAWDEGDFGREAGWTRAHGKASAPWTAALRYYDAARDYQPGLQRAEAAPVSAAAGVLEFPGVFTAGQARGLLAQAAIRQQQSGETLAWRMCELDPALAPGSLVRAPGMSGVWRVTGWEWRERGIELQLARHVQPGASDQPADAGAGWSPHDRLAVGTSLRAFELPWDGSGTSGAVQRFAAVSAPAGRWAGAALYRIESGALVPLAQSGRSRAVGGWLVEELAPDPGLRFDRSASVRIALENSDAELDNVSLGDMANGANRLLIGDEILQFAQAEAAGGGMWRLTGLLRGRGGTEIEALAGHAPATPVTLLDQRLMELPQDLALVQASQIAAIGIADSEPVIARIEGAGRSRRPLFPVHPRCEQGPTGGLTLGWTRRARGGWRWLAEVEQPVVEQEESFEVGLGDVDSPVRLWTVAEPWLELSGADVATLASLFPSEPLWVRQKGSFALSAPLFLTSLPPSS